MLAADDVAPPLFDLATRAQIVTLLKVLLSDRLALVGVLEPCCTTTFEHIGHWIKMRQSLDRFSRPESSHQIRSLADFIATTSGFSFSIHTGVISSRAILGGLHHHYARV
jgi:hypothetical protein